MTTLKSRFEQAETRISSLKQLRDDGTVPPQDRETLHRVDEQMDALNEELDALEVLGPDAVEELSTVMEQALENVEQAITDIENRVRSADINQ